MATTRAPWHLHRRLRRAPNGNRTSCGADRFEYDQANYLTSATVNGTTSSYTYDGDSKRASATTGGQATPAVYDVGGALPLLLDDGQRKYVWGLGLAYAVDSAGSIAVYHADGLGSARALTAGGGQLVQTERGDAFGVPTQTQGASTQPLGYTGEPRDAETGLVYLRARHYDPETGRFTTPGHLPQPCAPGVLSGTRPAPRGAR